jgi:hyperosmotically inducible protein
MKRINITATAICALFLAGCNRSTTDQGGTSPNSASDTSQGVSSQPNMNEHSRVKAPPAPADTNVAVMPPTPATPPQETAAKPADNTGNNVRDRSDATVTPGDQSESKTDLELTRRIRRAITQDNQLSTTAHNIKIVTANGKVTLRGPVKSAAEKDQIAKMAQGTEGVTSVDNQLEVTNNQ